MHNFVERLESRRLMDAGDLDLSFDGDGSLDLTAPGGASVRPLDVDVTEASQIVVTGVTDAGAAEGGVSFAYLWRLHPDGTRDVRFAGSDDGVLTLPIPRELMAERSGSFFNPAVRTVATPDDGFLVQIANVLYKFRSDGRRDRAFGGGRGKVETAYERHRLLDVAADAQGRIYLVGPGSDGQLAVRRLSADGAVDATFATGGTFAPPPGTAIEPSDFRLRVLRDGSVVAAGTAEGTAEPGEFSSAAFDLVAVKLTPAGALDTSYGQGGVARTQLSHTDLQTIDGFSPVVTADGSVYLSIILRDRSGTSSYDIESFDPSGAPGAIDDATAQFGYSGDVIRDDRILLLQQRGFPGPVRLLDGVGGTVADADLPEDFHADRFAIQRDGSILAMGRAPEDQDGTIRLYRFFRDDAPVGQLMAKTLTRERDGHYRFTVQWRDDDGLYASWLGGDADDLTVGFPDGTRRPAKLVDTQFADGGRLVTASYRVAAPDGVWDAADNGKYTVRIERRSVQDVQFHVAARREIGVFHVQIPVVVPFVPASAQAAPFASSAAADEREELDFDRLTGPPAA